MAKKNIYIVGFGWASIGFLKEIDINKYNINIISKSGKFNYTPLLAQNIKNNNKITFDIHNIINSNNVNLIEDEVNTIDFERNLVVANNVTANFDYLIFSHGSCINTFDISGVEENCNFIKMDDDSKKIKQRLLELPHNSKIIVVGCGLTGSEIIGTLIDYKKFTICALDALPRPLQSFDKNISMMAVNLWKRNGVELYLNNIVSKINKNSIQFKNVKEDLGFDMVIWCAGIKISPLSEKINKTLQLDCNKGIPVNKYLQIKNKPGVFAIGDCAYSGSPPTAQVAYQQGTYLAKQFNNNFDNKSKFEFNNKGQICYIGNRKSVFQNNYFKTGGTLTYYLNTFFHAYQLFILRK